MKQYLDLIKRVLETGVEKTDRTGTGTLSCFGAQLRFDLSEGFPLVTTKKVHLKSIIHELLWLISGDTNIKYLTDNKVTIWNEWADENGDLGPVYGKQWRAWPDYNNGEYVEEDEEFYYVDFETIDQLATVIQQIKLNPDSRRLLVSAWNPADVPNMKLPPCHYSFQFYVANNKLSCKFHMRSTDVFLGLPFNIASYALLTMMVAQVCDLELGELIYDGGDVHIYSNHIEQVKLQLTREPLTLPKMVINPEVKDIDDFKYEDFTLVGYQSHPAIKGEVAI